HDDKLYVASGGSHTVVELDLADFATTRVVEIQPKRFRRLKALRQGVRNLFGALMRKSFFDDVHLILQTYQVTGWQTFDGVYAVRASPDGRYLIAGHRGYNYVRVMDRRSL